MRYLLALLLACLLCGCAEAPAQAEAPAPESTPTQTIPEAASPTPRTDSPAELYPLSMEAVSGMRLLEDALLVFSGTESTTLTLLTGDTLQPSAVAELAFPLSDQDPSLRLGAGEFSFYDPVERQTLVLDSALRTVSRITAPEDLVGTPILSADRNTLYYCTDTAVRAWDLESGIRRTLKEMAYESQTLAGVHMEDAVLQCRICDGGKETTLFLSTQNGQQLSSWEGTIALTDLGARYYAAFPTGMTQALLFGEEEDMPQALIPTDLTAEGAFLEQLHAAVTVSQSPGEALRFDYYDLSSGLRCAALSLSAGYDPIAVEGTASGSVYILLHDRESGSETVCRWDIHRTPVTDSKVRTGPYYTAEAPDELGLALCQSYAAEIGAKHGIEILVWEDAAAAQPWDYDLEAEYLATVLEDQLLQLDQWLDAYPEGFLEVTASPFRSLKLCLVRSITGTAESGSLDNATGVQFLEDNDAYVVIALGPHARQAVYHELFHVMETHIWNESIALDQWDELNPAGFQYDYDYLSNKNRDSGVYLQAENRAFIDTYSMSYPKEDRARIMEYAMLPENEGLFQHELLQRKLKALCEGIREAYGLERSPESYLWEQYLKKSLAYSK